ncbi:para-nitrobenzyl esterase-like [Notolabrus celidotus]|uniref:para-nitrobenzyl esterase-like n=1 Tax=Notolabrus celidotus TaxID=1203425 RepID=UPI00148FFA9F|nr:para-nitrobenzyl esterase-like [Notolabrus celidotus]XP_034535024.1 para-nitrobenzyl esterase-like [Notolabrus celidotus]XP_034535032.1 para-nitrobenzyl esterase-like [Notolabrus celidotus]XP_034535040.1 para-nitrobenzyl esterase-like [Notolabrus celidotus]
MNEDAFEVPERTEYRYLVQEEGEEEPQFVRHRHYISPLLVLSRRCIFIICLGVLGLLSLAAYLGYIAQTLPPGLAQVTTDCGEFRGRHKDGAYSFKGMRYAAPPVGDLRWAPPADPECRSRLADAGRFGSSCAQARPLTSTGKEMGQEDCLFINVWTPSLQPEAKLPVVVWIHGGGLMIFSGGEQGYSPTEKLSADTGIVYVSFNYRLNAFGFLALELLREGSPKNNSGNYGFMDQIAALKWVQRNIHVFGGDPGKVTILGQSAGGTSVRVLMMSPLAKGLFHGAVDMSGSYVRNSTLEQAESDNLVFLRKTGCKDLTCLRGLPIKRILEAAPFEEYPSWAADLSDLPVRGIFAGQIVVTDGYVLEGNPFEVWEKKGDYNDVPFVIGTTEQEVDVSPHSPNITMWTWGDYHWFVRENLQTFSESLPNDALDLYPSSQPCPTTDRCPERAYTTMVSDIRSTCPNNDLAWRAAAALQSPVYRYVVTYTPSGPVNVSSDLLPFPSRFSFHSLDILAFFGGLEDALGKPLSDEDRKFQDLITRHLVNFAKTGKMESEWPEYPSAIAVLTDGLSVHQNYSYARCQLWKSNGLYDYAWMN